MEVNFVLKGVRSQFTAEELVQRHMHLVSLNVNKFQSLDREEAVSTAMMALGIAALKWDSSKGLFASFAAVGIRNRLLDAVTKQKAVKRGWGVDHVRLDQMVGDSGDVIGELIADESAVPPDSVCVQNERKRLAFECVRKLPFVHRAVLKLIFKKDTTVGKVSALVGIDREEVVRIRDNALEYLRSPALPIKKAKIRKHWLPTKKMCKAATETKPPATKLAHKAAVTIAVRNPTLPIGRLGRPPVDATCMEFACALMDELHCSSRKTVVVMKHALGMGCVKSVPHYNSILNYRLKGFTAREETRILVRAFLEQ